MNGLMNLVLQAHGGLERWNKLKTIKIDASITGGIWYIKSRPDVLKDITFELATQEEKVTMRFPGQEKMTIFELGLITVQTGNPQETKEWKNPKSSFTGHELHTPWLDVHVAYFSGEALWTYLTIPFLYTYPGFISTEIEPWYENGEVWRRLKVIFPNNIASHTREQVSYFGPDGLLRRHDYTVDILGGATGANYATNYQNIDGIIIPASRRVYAYEQDGSKVIYDPLLVSIEMNKIVME